MSIVEDFGNVAEGTGENKAGDGTSQTFDPSRYRAEIDQFDISEEQKQELLTTLWSIMRSFVELGFRADVCTMVFPKQEAILKDHELG